MLNSDGTMWLPAQRWYDVRFERAVHRLGIPFFITSGILLGIASCTIVIPWSTILAPIAAILAGITASVLAYLIRRHQVNERSGVYIEDNYFLRYLLSAEVPQYRKELWAKRRAITATLPYFNHQDSDTLDSETHADNKIRGADARKAALRIADEMNIDMEAFIEACNNTTIELQQEDTEQLKERRENLLEELEETQNSLALLCAEAAYIQQVLYPHH